MKKTTIAFLIIASVMFSLCASLVFVGCGGQKADQPEGRRTLTFLTFLNPAEDNPRSLAQREIFEEFKKKNPNVDVEILLVGWAEIAPRLIQAVAAGNPPDVTRISLESLSQQFAAGTLQDLGPYINKMPDADTWKKDWVLDFNQGLYNGQKLTLPIEYRANVIAYNKKHLKEIGLTELPKTWDELGAVARQLSANGHVGYGLGLSQGSQGLSLMDWFYPVFWSFGGEMEDANGKATFNSPAGVKTMQILYDLVYKYNAISQDILESDTDAVLQAFQAGRVSMYTMGTHRFTTAQHVLNADGSDSVGWAPIPSDNPDKPSPARIGFWSMVIPKGSKNPDLAWEFIVNYISPQSNTVNAKLAGEMPARNSAYNDPWFSSNPLGKEMTGWKEYINNYGLLSLTPPDYTRIHDIMCNAAQRIIFQRQPIQASLDAAARECDMK